MKKGSPNITVKLIIFFLHCGCIKSTEPAQPEPEEQVVYKESEEEESGEQVVIVKRTNRVIKRKKLIGLLLRRVLGSTVLKMMVKKTKRSHIIP